MPEHFNNIIGNDKLKKMLISYISNNTMPHALIIEGAVGSGKKHIAKSIAAAISCKNKDSKRVPCLECINCEKIFHDVSPDVMVVDKMDKSSIGVDLIREVVTHTYISPNELDCKTYIINEADKMTTEAQNAFLKSLEEPVTDVMYFLICENSQMLLPTIISRAPVVRTTPVSKDSIISYLNAKNFERNKVRECAVLCRGNLGIALEYLNDLEKYSEAMTLRSTIYEFLDILKNNGRKSEILVYFKKIGDKNDTQTEQLRLLYSAFRDIIMYKDLRKDLFDFFTDSEDIKKYTPSIKPKFAKKVCISIEKAIEALSLNQGSSSMTAIMFTLASEICNAKH